MSYSVFFLNITIVLFCVWGLKLLGRKFISMPVVYLMLSLLPTFSLLSSPLVVSAQTRPGYEMYLQSMILHTFFICFGLFLSYIFFNNYKVPKRIFKKEALNFGKQSYAVIIFTIFIISFIHQLVNLSSIPFYLIFTGSDVAELTMARESGYKLHGGAAVYVWHFSRMVLAPYVFCLSYAYFFKKRTKASIVFLMVAGLICIVNNGLSGAKAPVAMLFMCVAILHIHMTGKINLRSMALLFIAMLTFPFIVEYTYSPQGFIDTLVRFSQKVVNRFSYETFDRTLSYFDTVPHELNFLGGRTNKLFTLATGNEYFNIQNYVFLKRLDVIHPHLLHGSANAHFIGYMYTDFGLWGVGISSLIIGGIIGALDCFSAKMIKNIHGVIFYVVMAFIFWKLMGSQPTTVLFSHGVVLCFIFILIFKFKLKLEA